MSDIMKTEASSTIHAEVGDSYISAGLAHDDRPEKSKAEKRLVLKQDLLITTLMSGAFFFAYLVCRCNVRGRLSSRPLTYHRIEVLLAMPVCLGSRKTSASTTLSTTTVW
jgi:hypothetical protein